MRSFPSSSATLLAVAILTASGAQSGAHAQDTSFCGRPTGEPAALQAAIAKDTAVKEIHRGADYVAYQDTANDAVYTFTLAAQGTAHPAAICRKPVKDGDNMLLQMVIVCKGEGNACQQLESDFKLLNAQMEAAIRNESGQGGQPVVKK